MADQYVLSQSEHDRHDSDENERGQEDQPEGQHEVHAQGRRRPRLAASVRAGRSLRPPRRPGRRSWRARRRLLDPRHGQAAGVEGPRRARGVPPRRSAASRRPSRDHRPARHSSNHPAHPPTTYGSQAQPRRQDDLGEPRAPVQLSWPEAQNSASKGPPTGRMVSTFTVALVLPQH